MKLIEVNWESRQQVQNIPLKKALPQYESLKYRKRFIINKSNHITDFI